MLKTGIYIWESDEPGIWGGHIRLHVKETEKSFILRMVENTCRFNAPQMEDLFMVSDRLAIRKDGSKHAMTFVEGDNEWFCLYPWRVGVPYAFHFEGGKS